MGIGKRKRQCKGVWVTEGGQGKWRLKGEDGGGVGRGMSRRTISNQKKRKKKK